jgi:hypothetical protein
LYRRFSKSRGALLREREEERRSIPRQFFFFPKASLSRLKVNKFVNKLFFSRARVLCSSLLLLLMKDDDNDWKKERGLYVEAFRGPFFQFPQNQKTRG